MKCFTCGTEMVSTTGGWYCPKCQQSVNVCGFTAERTNRDVLTPAPSSCDLPLPQAFGQQRGWICPLCGRALAPWVSMCPCTSSEISYGTDTDSGSSKTVDELEELFRLNDIRVAEMINFSKEWEEGQQKDRKENDDI